MNAPFRLIESGPGEGARNMALDEALFLEAESPVFRIYGWNPPCVSLGRFQDAAVIDRKALEQAGYGLTRRLTGGGWILHDREITYSIVCPLAVGGISVKEAYCEMTRFLVEFYRSLGLPASFACDLPGYREKRRTEICFAGHEPYDILIDGRKIGGNAQRINRRQGLVLQHGSIPLSIDRKALQALSRTPGEMAGMNAAGLVEFGIAPDAENLSVKLITAFEKSHGLLQSVKGPSEREEKRAEELNAAKFGREEWITGIQPL